MEDEDEVNVNRIQYQQASSLLKILKKVNKSLSFIWKITQFSNFQKVFLNPTYIVFNWVPGLCKPATDSYGTARKSSCVS